MCHSVPKLQSARRCSLDVAEEPGHGDLRVNSAPQIVRVQLPSDLDCGRRLHFAPHIGFVVRHS